MKKNERAIIKEIRDIWEVELEEDETGECRFTGDVGMLVKLAHGGKHREVAKRLKNAVSCCLDTNMESALNDGACGEIIGEAIIETAANEFLKGIRWEEISKEMARWA